MVGQENLSVIQDMTQYMDADGTRSRMYGQVRGNKADSVY